MISNFKKRSKEPFLLEVISSRGEKDSWILDKSHYTLGSSTKCDIQLTGPAIAKVHCTLEVKENMVQLKTVDDAAEGIIVDNHTYKKAKLKHGSMFVLGEYQVLLHQVPVAHHKLPKSAKKSSARLSTSDKKINPDDVNFKNEKKFKVLQQLPIEINRDNVRFQDYIDTDEAKPYAILPDAKIDRRRVVEVIFMSYGNIVGFESIPLDDYYLNKLYQFLPFDLVKLFPDEKDWVRCNKGKLSYSVPHGWKALSNLENPAVFHIAKDSNQLVMRISKGLAPLTAWNFWRDRADFYSTLRKMSIMFLPILLLTAIPYPKEKTPVDEVDTVVLYKPEIVKPAPTPMPTPEPTKIAEVKPTPKPTPVRVAKVDPPKNRIKPTQVIPKVEPIQKVKRLVVTQGPVKTGGSGPANPRAKADEAAKMQAQKIAQTNAKVSTALGFLAKSNGLIKVLSSATSGGGFLAGRGLAGTKNATGKNALANIGTDRAGSSNGPINTKGSRSIASGPVVSDGEVKGLNNVQGKVSVGGLHSAGGSGSFGSTGSVAISGNIDQDAVRRAIEKYMNQIRHCYEKALLSNPRLAGGLRMEWNISLSGKAMGTHVTQSSVNDASLHACVVSVINIIPFPHPKGGIAKVGYPFDFNSFQ